MILQIRFGFIYLLWTSYLFFLCKVQSSQKPDIRPGNDSIALEFNSNYELLCEDETKVFWQFKSSRTVYKNVNNSHQVKKYGQLLYLKNVTAEDVGYYCCLRVLKLSDYRCIYIFVNDPNVILVPGKDNVMNVKRGMIIDSTSVKYFYPKFGFYWGIGSKIDEGLYVCRPKYPSASNLQAGTSFFVRIFEELEKNTTQSARNQVAHITSFPSGPVTAGESLVLKCFVEQSNATINKFYWESPNKMEPVLKYQVEPSVEVQSSQLLSFTNYVIKSAITITNFQKTDEGFYTCWYMDKDDYILANGSYFAKYIASSCDPVVHFIYSSKRTKSSIEFIVNFQSYPALQFKWIAPNKSIIKANWTYFQTTTENRTSLEIHVVSIKDTGKYIFSASNTIRTENLTFWYHLQGEPNILVEPYYFNQTKGQEVRIPFKIFANSTPLIKCGFCFMEDVYTNECLEKPNISYNNITTIVSDTETIFELIFTPNTGKVIKVEINVTHELGTTFGESVVLYGDDIPETKAPGIFRSNLGPDIESSEGEFLELTCKVSGLPRPIVTWYKDDAQINTTSNVLFLESGSILKIQNLTSFDYGLYECLGKNKLGVVKKSSKVKRRKMTGLQLGWTVGIGIFLVILVVYMSIAIIKMRKNLKKLKLEVLDNFENGANGELDPNLFLNEQADLLPYKRCYEFPENRLKFGEKLGSGAFGVVLKAIAERIVPDEEETVVAVKMIKRNADNEVLKALISELKVMIHLGKHLNVVNLLGAVTKNIDKRDVMVIVEYCEYGCVQNVLKRNRKTFVDETIPETSRKPNLNNEKQNHYLVLNDSEETKNRIECDSTEALVITTSDLIIWAFQVARGMEYLSSKRVLHRDLAARNILLCKNNIVKICDFGLSKSIYRNNIYKKESDTPLPIKWLALESLTDGVFNVRTDVWSFGITLWEFFSLAEEPYPEMDANHEFFIKLRDGHRMDMPLYANQELYDIMLDCWSEDPEERPLFNELEAKLYSLLGESIANHYVDLNTPYLKKNLESTEQNEAIYMNLMEEPHQSVPLLTSPVYLNEMTVFDTNQISSDGYLKMFSTRIKNDVNKKCPRLEDGYVQPDNVTCIEEINSASGFLPMKLVKTSQDENNSFSRLEHLYANSGDPITLLELL